MDVGIEKEPDHFVALLSEAFDRMNGAIGAADVEEDSHFTLGPDLFRSFSRRPPEFFLDLQDLVRRLDHRVRIERDAVDAAPHQELGELRVVTRRLAADAYL